MGKTVTRTYYRDAKGRFASKGTPGAIAVEVKHNVGKERKRLQRELSAKQQEKLVTILKSKGLKGKGLEALGKELDGLNLSELRKLTHKVGISQPVKYRNRKDSWKQNLLSQGNVTPQRRAATREELLAGGNKGSKKRNLEAKTWLKKQLSDERIPIEDRALLKESITKGVPRPYPLGDGRSAKAAWRETVSNAIKTYDALQEGSKTVKAPAKPKSKKPKKEVKPKSEGRLGYGNKGSKARNQAKGLWVTKQLLRIDIPDNVEDLLSQFRAKGLYKQHTIPYPIGGSETAKAKWFKDIKALL